MDYSAFYYTFSTIAQTLAGAFGFLVAAVLFRIQHLTGNVIPGLEEANKRANETIDQLTKGDPHSESIPARRKQQSSILLSILKQYETVESVRFSLAVSLYFTAGVISWCVIAMPLTPVLGRLGLWFVSSPLVVAVLGALTCIGLYVRVVIITVGPIGLMVRYPGKKAKEQDEGPTTAQ